MTEEKFSPEIPPEPQPAVKSAPTPEVTPKPADNRLKIILFSILGLVLVGGLVFMSYKFVLKQTPSVSQPTPTPLSSEVSTKEGDPTANWKTYTNREFRLEMKYPPTWSISEKYTTVVLINTSKPSQKIEILKSSGPPPETMDMKAIESKEVVVDNIKTKRALMQGSFEGNENRYYLRVFIREKEIFYQAGFDGNSFEELSLIYDKILSTFNFLEEETEGEKVFCKEPRPEICTMECIVNPPYICGSDGKSHCTVCQACSDPKVEWYIIQDKPCSG